MIQAIGELHWTAILAATVAYFALGGLWFAPFTFGKWWNKAIGFEPPAGWKPSPMYYIDPFIGGFFATLATAILIQTLRINTYADGIALGLIAGVGYSASVSFVNAITPKIPRPLLYGATTGAYHTASVILAAVVIVAMQ